MEETITMYRPIGPKELELLKVDRFKKWPPRLPEQPIFYPVENEEYARQISSEWNLKEYGSGFVTRFKVRKNFMKNYQLQKVGGNIHLEWWIPSEKLEEFNSNIVGDIEVIAEFHKNDSLKK